MVGKDWCKRLRQRFCRHSYSAINLETTRYKHNIIFSNGCVKCGKVYSMWVSEWDIDIWLKSDLMRRMSGNE